MDDWKIVIYAIAAFFSLRVLIVLMMRHKHRYHRDRLLQEQRKLRAQHLAEAAAEEADNDEEQSTEAA